MIHDLCIIGGGIVGLATAMELLKRQPAELLERHGAVSDPVALGRLHQQVWSEGHSDWLDAWRQSVDADPHAPLLPLQPLMAAPQPA
mgnify:CR=1 FL=1